MVVVTPFLDVILTHQIKRTYQLHTLKIRAVQFWHHGLHLCPVKHSHKDSLDHIIIMMSQSDLVAAQFLCLVVEMPSAHTRAQITWRFLDLKDRIKNI